MNLDIKDFLMLINEFLTLFLVFPSIILLGLYLTVRLRCVQVCKLKMSFQCLLKKDKNQPGDINHYEAISTVLAGNFGTGNISGMAIAITTGGPGALIWMWVMAFLGAAIQYASCVLGVKYRKQDREGKFMGGPMYYLQDGLGLKVLGILFSLATILGAFMVGNLAQVNSIILPLEALGLNPLLCSLLIAMGVAVVILGGVQRVAKFASVIVPIKAFLYLSASLLILFWHKDQVLPAFNLMFKAAFNSSAILGGTLGFGMLKAITAGFDRGLFATDAGTGIVPILQASAKTEQPIIDGVVTLVAPFLVMIVCTMTGLVLIVTGAWQQANLYSTNMVTHAFRQGLGSDLGSYIVMIALLLFAYTTILAWSCCAEKALDFLFGNKSAIWFKYFYVALIPIGTILHVDMIWILADISISLMLLLNLIGVAGLSSSVIAETHSFFNKDLRLEAA